MNFYKFHIGDYASATRHLTWDEDLAYRRLLDAYYIEETPLPVDRRAVYRLACAATDEHRSAVDTVLEEFFTLTDDGWRHFRCDAEIANASEKGAKASAAAKKRWAEGSKNADAMHNECERNANAMRTHSESDANASKIDATHNPLPTTHNPDKNSTRASRFDAFRHLVSLGVSESIANDWIALRKAKKAAPTATAIHGIHREADKAGVSLADALALCCQRGWQGFKAEWVVESMAGRIQTVSDKRAAAVAYLTGKSTTDENVIQGEVTRVA